MSMTKEKIILEAEVNTLTLHSLLLDLLDSETFSSSAAVHGLKASLANSEAILHSLKSYEKDCSSGVDVLVENLPKESQVASRLKLRNMYHR